MLALPYPEPGGKVSLLRPLINLVSSKDQNKDQEKNEKKEQNWMLFRSFSCWVPLSHGSLSDSGDSRGTGRAKSTLARIARTLVDPHELLLRRQPREERDLMVAAANNHVVAFDNVSHLLHMAERRPVCALHRRRTGLTKAIYR